MIKVYVLEIKNELVKSWYSFNGKKQTVITTNQVSQAVVFHSEYDAAAVAKKLKAKVKPLDKKK